MNCFGAVRKHGIGVIAGIKLVSFGWHTLQNDGVMNVREYRHQLFLNRAHNPIKYSLLTDIKHIYSMVLDQINQNIPQLGLN